jgi:hypothetical protein
MNRFEEFLQGLDIKNKIMLYLSVLIVGIIIYYNFNYNNLNAQIEDNNRLLKSLNKKIHISKKDYILKLNKLKKEYKNLKILKNEKIQDLEYLNKRIDLSYLNINDKNFYSFLENILYKSSILDLNPNFYITQNFDKFKRYVIEIKGSLGFCEEENLFNFIRFLESSRYVVNVDSFKLDKNGSGYFIRYNIWGVK